MTDDAVNLPDLLGVITDGLRVNVDVVQCALGVRPSTTPAGQPFEAILLLQNASDADVDVTAHLQLPDRDAQNERNRFFSQSERLLVGLRPAEVGYLTLPVSCSPKTAPDSAYELVMDLSVKRMGKHKPRRVRDPEGGGLFVETELPQETQDHIWKLQQMIFSVARSGRAGLSASFAIRPPTLGQVADFSPGWVSLWTMRDHVDESMLIDRVQEHLDIILPKLKRDTVFFPLLDVVQTRFREAGYPLKAGEAVFIAKMLTLTLENGAVAVQQAALDDEPADYPEWFTRACRLIFDQADVARNVVFLVTNLVFDELVRDAVRMAFAMVATVTNQDFGDDAEQADYARQVSGLLRGGGMDFAHAYLPLALGGLIANTRIVMPHERPRETAWLLNKAREARAGELDEMSQPVFAMTDTLVDRALDQTG